MHARTSIHIHTHTHTHTHRKVAFVKPKDYAKYPTISLRLTDKKPPVYLDITPEKYFSPDYFDSVAVMIKEGNFLLLGDAALAGSVVFLDRETKDLGLADTVDCSEFE